MEEQSPTDPTRGRRQQPKSTPRQRPAKATFTPPTSSTPPSEPSESENPVPRSPAPMLAPAVLFQPPPAEEPPPGEVPLLDDEPPAGRRHASTDDNGQLRRNAAHPDSDPQAFPTSAALTSRSAVEKADGRLDAGPPGPEGARTPAGRKAVAAKRAAGAAKKTTTRPAAAEVADGRDDLFQDEGVTAPAAQTRTSTAADSAAGAPAPAAPATSGTTAPARRIPRKAASPKPPRPRKRADSNAGAGDGGKETAEVPATRTAIRIPGAEALPVAARILDHPGYAPELLALAAVDALGPAALAWVERTRAAYPAATPDALAQLATRQFVRLAGAGGAASATIGLLGPLAELVTVYWAQAGLVLRVAAAYGADPTDPDRAIDLLVLAKAHPDDDSARTALTAAKQAGPGSDQPLQRMAEAAWRLAVPFAVQTGGVLAVRLVGRLIPGAAILTAAARGSATVERLGARAVARYRPGRVPPGTRTSP